MEKSALKHDILSTLRCEINKKCIILKIPGTILCCESQKKVEVHEPFCLLCSATPENRTTVYDVLLRPLCWCVSLALRLKLRLSEVGRAEMKEKCSAHTIEDGYHGRLSYQMRPGAENKAPLASLERAASRHNWETTVISHAYGIKWVDDDRAS